jgi:hypothetical protein
MLNQIYLDQIERLNPDSEVMVGGWPTRSPQGSKGGSSINSMVAHGLSTLPTIFLLSREALSDSRHRAIGKNHE